MTDKTSLQPFENFSRKLSLLIAYGGESPELNILSAMITISSDI